MLARTGHHVVVLDGDDLTPAADVEAAAARALRAAAPQIVQPHVLLTLCLAILRARLPAVQAALRDAGAAEATLVSQMPATIADRSPAATDERMSLVMTRRSTLDWVLGRLAAAEPGVDLRFGTRVTGLVAEPGDPPRVTGVRNGWDHRAGRRGRGRVRPPDAAGPLAGPARGTAQPRRAGRVRPGLLRAAVRGVG